MEEKNYIKGLVSVITPTYRRSETLTRAIESVLNQTYGQLELLVVNDNNPDDEFTKYVKEVTEKYQKDKRFRLIIQEKHINGAVARNVAIREAKGEFVAFLDDDDWWEENKLEEQINVLTSLDSSWGGVSCLFRFYDSDGKLIGKTKKYEDGNIYKDILSLYTDVATSTLLLRRTALDQAGYFDEKLLRNQDIQLLAQFTYKFKLKLVNQYLHCVDVSDAQNRMVDEEKYLKIRKDLYNSIKPIILSLSTSELSKINALRDLELGYILLKNKKYTRGFKYILSVFNSPGSFVLAVKKLKRRLDMTRHLE